MTGDALLYGELARNLAAGRGFVASFLYPISLAYVPLQTLPQPHVLYQPAYPALLAGVFGVAGASDTVILATNVALAWALLATTFLVARRLFDLPVACVATAALALDTTVASNVRNGGTEVLAMVVVTAIALVLAAKPTAWTAALAGALLGLAYLTRPNLLVLLPLAAAALWRMKAPAAILPLMAGAALAIGPWVVRGWVVMGHPFFSLYAVANVAWDVPSAPGLIATYGTLVPRGLGAMLAEHPGELLAKLGTNLAYYARQAVFTANPMAVVAFVAGLGVWRHAGRARALAEWVVGSAAVTVLLASALAREPRYLAPFAPLVVVLGVGWAFAAAAAIGRPGLRVAAAMLMLALPVAGTLRDLSTEPGSRWRDPNLATVATLTRERDVIVTDIGRGVTWYTGRATVQAPIDRATLERVAVLVPVSALYLSARAVPGWGAMYGAPLVVDAYVPAGWALAATFPDGGRVWRRPDRPVH